VNFEKFFSTIIIMVLVVAFLTGVVAPLFRPPEEKTIKDAFTLNESQVSGIKRVNINVESNVSGVAVKFENGTDFIYSIETERGLEDAKPIVNYTVEGDTLNVDMGLDEGSVNILLSNRYIYNVTTRSKVGGITLVLGNDSKVDKVNSTIQYAGGGTLLVDKATFKNVSMNVNTGGFSIALLNPEFKGNGSIVTNVTIGGVTVAQMDPSYPLRIVANVDIGGVTFESTGFNVIRNTTSYLEMETGSYKSSGNRLEIICGVGLGGVSVGTFQIPIKLR